MWYHAASARLLLTLTIVAGVYAQQQGFPQNDYQSFDGYFNNPAHPTWGAREGELARETQAQFGDGAYIAAGYHADADVGDNDPSKNEPREGSGGGLTFKRFDRPNARQLSNLLFEKASDQAVLHPRNLTALFTWFGQHLVYEIVDTQVHSCPAEYLSVTIPPGDQYCGEDECPDEEEDLYAMPMVRSQYVYGSGRASNHPRGILNAKTPWLDLDTVYGPSRPWNNQLRSFEGGKLAEGEKNGLPPLNDIGMPLANPTPPKYWLDDEAAKAAGLKQYRHSKGQFLTGNRRGGENPGMLALQSLWIRVHNWRAQQLRDDGFSQDDEQLFHRARQWTIAEFQHVVFDEWLPLLLNTPDPLGDYAAEGGFISALNPQVMLEFASVAMRVGHSLVPTGLMNRASPSDSCAALGSAGGDVRLCQGYYNSQEVYGVDDALATPEDVILGMTSQITENLDLDVVEDMRTYMFGSTGFSRRDVMALNIQRGRDHGVADYNSMRRAFGLAPRATMQDVVQAEAATCNHRCGNITAGLAGMYKGDVDDVDAFVGGMLETDDVTGTPGPLFSAVIREQFRRLRHADRFYWEFTGSRMFNGSERAEIQATRMADLIGRAYPKLTAHFAAFPDVFVNDDNVPQRCHRTGLSEADWTDPEDKCSPLQRYKWREIPTQQAIGLVIFLICFELLVYLTMKMLQRRNKARRAAQQGLRTKAYVKRRSLAALKLGEAIEVSTLQSLADEAAAFKSKDPGYMLGPFKMYDGLKRRSATARAVLLTGTGMYLFKVTPDNKLYVLLRSVDYSIITEVVTNAKQLLVRIPREYDVLLWQQGEFVQSLARELVRIVNDRRRAAKAEVDAAAPPPPPVASTSAAAVGGEDGSEEREDDTKGEEAAASPPAAQPPATDATAADTPTTELPWRQSSAADLSSEAKTKLDRQKELEAVFKKMTLKAVQATAGFSAGEAQDLQNAFANAANSEVVDGQLDRFEFAELFKVPVESEFLKRMFTMADTDGDGFVSFKEFLVFMNYFSKESRKDKTEFLFDLHDLDNNGVITRHEMRQMLRSNISMNGLVVPEAEIESALDSMYKDAPNGIDREGFRKLMGEHQGVIERLTVSSLVKSRDGGDSDKKKPKIGLLGEAEEAGLRRENTGLTKLTEAPLTVRFDAFNRKSGLGNWSFPLLVQYRLFIQERGQSIALTVFYVLINIGIFAERSWVYALERHNGGLDKVAGAGVIFTRGAASVMAFNMTILLLTMSRTLITKLRNTALNNFIPFDKSIEFHKLVAYIFIGTVLVHICGHTINFWNVSSAVPADVLCVLDELVVHSHVIPPMIQFWLLSTVTGLTGVLLTVIMMIMVPFTFKSVREGYFVGFWVTHHLYIPLYFLTYLHGSLQLVQAPLFWHYSLGVLCIYVLDRLLRLSRFHRWTEVVAANILPSRVLNLVMAKPPGFNYNSGQWIYIMQPELSSFEKHPFTLTSAPYEKYISVHIRVVGAWTTAMLNIYKHRRENPPPVKVDGPFGETHQGWNNYKVALLLGGGIGVTPFASILKDLLFRVQLARNNFDGSLRLRKIYFFWVCRRQESFEWFADLINELEANDVTEILEVHTFITGAFQEHDLRSMMLWVGENHFRKERGRSLFTGVRSTTHFGRPNFNAAFKQMKQEHPHTRIGVFMCGPRPLGGAVRRAAERQTDRARGEVIDVFLENF